MTVHSESHAVELDATPDEVFEVLSDYERLPGWQGPLKSCRVLSRDAEGLGLEVEYVVDAKLREVRYVLEHSYERPHRIGSSYVEGDFASMDGGWVLEERPGGGCRAELTLAIDPGLPIPGLMRRKINEQVLKRSVEDLRKRLAAG
jgi:coenzyme Q-binding protein COQ10